jgi:hypothetical protein
LKKLLCPDRNKINMAPEAEEQITNDCLNSDYALCISLFKLEGQLPSSLATQIFPHTTGSAGVGHPELTVGVDLNTENDGNPSFLGPTERLLSTKFCVIGENEIANEASDKSREVPIDDDDSQEISTVVGLWEEAPVAFRLGASGRQTSSATTATTGNTFEVPLKANPGESGFSAHLDLSSMIPPPPGTAQQHQYNSKHALQWGTAELNISSEILQNLAETVPLPAPSLANEFFGADGEGESQDDTPEAVDPLNFSASLSLVESMTAQSTDYVDMRIPVMFNYADVCSAPSDMVLHIRVRMQDELLLAMRNGILQAHLVDGDAVINQPESRRSKPLLFGCLGPDFFDVLRHFLCIDKESSEASPAPIEPMNCATAFAANDPTALMETLSIASSIDTYDKYSPGATFDLKKDVRVEIASWVEPPKVKHGNDPFFCDVAEI